MSVFEEYLKYIKRFRTDELAYIFDVDEEYMIEYMDEIEKNCDNEKADYIYSRLIEWGCIADKDRKWKLI